MGDIYIYIEVISDVRRRGGLGFTWGISRLVSQGLLGV